MDILALVLGVPALLMAALLALARLEASLVAPDERAARLSSLIESARAPEEVEHAATELFAEVVPVHGRRDARAA